jgi:hypothetical protein
MKQKKNQIEAVINGKEHGKPSFKNIYPYSTLNSYKNTYRKATRKPALSTNSLNAKPKVQTQRELGNPLCEAMEIGPRLDGLAVFRAPAKLPPVYQAQLKELEGIERGIESYNTRVMNHNPETNSLNFKLKFSMNLSD